MNTGDDFAPIRVRTQSAYKPLDPVAYDCIKIIVVRAGSAILFSEFGERPVNIGDVILIAANTLCGAEPEGWIRTTTLYLDRDYVIDQVFWQYAERFTDRFDAKQFLDTSYAEPAQIVRPGEDRAGLLMPWLDELAALSVEGLAPERFYRIQSLLFAVLDVIVPDIAVTDRRATPTQRSATHPSVPRHRQFVALREEARPAPSHSPRPPTWPAATASSAPPDLPRAHGRGGRRAPSRHTALMEGPRMDEPAPPPSRRHRRRTLVVAIAAAVIAIALIGRRRLRAYPRPRHRVSCRTARHRRQRRPDRDSPRDRGRVAVPDPGDPRPGGVRPPGRGAIFTWDTTTGYTPSDYTQQAVDVGDPSGTETPGLAADLADYLPNTATWTQLRTYQTRQWLTIDTATIPSSWAQALQQGKVTLPAGTTAYTITGTRHRAGVWDGRRVTTTGRVSFTVFETCQPTYPTCRLLRLSQLDNPLS